MLLAPFGWPGYAGPTGMRNNLREPSHTVHTQFLNFNLLNKTPASPCYACCPCKSIQATPGKTDPTTHLLATRPKKYAHFSPIDMSQT